jgi:ribosomal protein L32E
MNPLNKAEGLKVREHPQTGPYIEGLENVIVHNFKEINQLMAEGNRMRTIAKVCFIRLMKKFTIPLDRYECH